LGAMLPVPPRPVEMTGFLRVGVSRSDGCRRGDWVVSAMLPAPPRPWEEKFDMMIVR
jgi:hypothetical protein